MKREEKTLYSDSSMRN